MSTVRLQVRTGNGVLDPAMGESATDAGGCSLEAGIIQPESTSLHNTLTDLGIPHVWAQYGWGCHSVALFEQQIRETLPIFEQAFTAPAAAPAVFDYRSIEPHFDVWGWSITADPIRALEFLDLHNVSTRGMTITGSGRTLVTTPSLFRGARVVRVLIDGALTRIRPDSQGRISFAVDLGPAGQQQQYTAGAVTSRRTSQVLFERP
jgi:hypothetical protein